jgi:putative hemolysin
LQGSRHIPRPGFPQSESGRSHERAGRRDLRIPANSELARIEELGPLIAPVDPFGGLEAVRANVTGMRRALRWLAVGGALLVFPARDVSHLRLRSASRTR